MQELTNHDYEYLHIPICFKISFLFTMVDFSALYLIFEYFLHQTNLGSQEILINLN